MRLWPTSVRARLALSHGAALLVVVTAYAVFVYAEARDGLYEQLDRQLAGDYSLVAGAVQSDPAGAAAVPLPQPRSGSHRTSAWVEVWNGHELVTSRPTAELTSALGPASAARVPAASVALPDGTIARVLSGTVTRAGGDLIVRVGRSERGIREEIGEMRAALALGLPIAFAFAVGAGYLLARRALAPVESMTARARLITADHLGERLPIENPRDEFGQLATVFNDALSRLDASFTTLRRFTADASHELRTPLTVIRSVGEVGLREPRDAAAYRDIIGSILEETDRLTQLVDGLLTLSRADGGALPLTKTSFDLAELAHEVGDVLGVLAEEKRQTLTIAGAPLQVVADRAIVRQALVNLLDNAVKHSPDGAGIGVSVRRDSDGAVVEVVDDGPGIPEEHLGHIFDRFYRIDQGRSREAGGGTGLGLSISRWAVEAHGGRIAVESHPGKGSLFRVMLPVKG